VFDEAYRQAISSSGADRLEQLAAAVRVCRGQRGRQLVESPAQELAGRTLASAVAGELAQASARLPERQREVLALRELLRLSYDQIAYVLAIEPAAVAPLLARARLRLRAERRGSAMPEQADCPDRERALRCMAGRQDSEPLGADDDRWLLEHLRDCGGCAQAHAAMLEASVCYRGWRARSRSRRIERADRPEGATAVA